MQVRHPCGKPDVRTLLPPDPEDQGRFARIDTAEDALIDPVIEKQRLRAALKAARQAIPAAERLRAGEAAADRLWALPALPAAAPIAGYWATGGELPLHAVLARLGPDGGYCLPRLADDRRLRFAPWRPGQPLHCNRYGIPEPAAEETAALAPEQLAVVLLPLLGFDRGGHRLGQGGGWYDRSFAFRRHAPAPPLLVGIGYACQELPRVPREDWDLRLDYIVTERELIRAC